MSDLLAGPEPERVYMRVAAEIEAKIRSGELPAGGRLRSERDLAEQFGVSYGTIRRAMQVLRERGLIETVHGSGTYIRAV